jgi:hypothetical protein
MLGVTAKGRASRLLMVLGVGERKRTSAAEAEEPSRVCNHGVGQGIDHCVTAGYRINFSSCFSMDHKKAGVYIKLLEPPYYFPGRRFECTGLLGRGVPETNETMRTPPYVPATVIHGWIRSLRGAIPEPRNSDLAMISNRVVGRCHLGRRKKTSINPHGDVLAWSGGPHFNSLLTMFAPLHLPTSMLRRHEIYNTNTWSVSS